MTHPPFFIAPDALDGSRLHLTGDAAHRIQHTLRLQAGDAIRVGDGTGTIYDGRIETLARGAVDAAMTEERTLPAEPAPHVELVQVLPKPVLADRLLAPCTTLGVSAFRFARGAHSPVGGGADEWAPRVERWQRIIRQACEQCERGWLPTCDLSDSLEACLQAHPAPVRLVGDEPRAGSEAHTLRAALVDAAAAETVQWVIGPEGGFSEAERERFPEWGLCPVSLGPHVLRLETAGVVAVALLSYELGRIGA